MSFLEKTIGNISLRLTNQIYRSVVLFFRIAILTTYLEKEDFAIIAIANLFVGFVELFQDMGFSVGILHKQKISKEEYSTLYWFNLGVGIILTFIICCIAFPVSYYYDDSILLYVIFFLSINVFLSSLGNQHRTVLQKHHKHRFIVLIDMIGLTINLILSWLLASNGFGVYALVYSMIAYSLFSNMIFAFWGIFIKKNILFYYNKQLLKPFFKIGFYQMFSRFLDYFVRQLDILFISTNFTKAETGLYSLCKNFVVMVYGFTAPVINSILIPILSTIQNEKALINKKINEMLALSSVLIMPLFFICAFFSFDILYFIYGKTYTDGAIVLSALLLGYSFLPGNSIISSLVMAKGQTKLGLKWTVCNSIVSLLFYLLFINLSLNSLTIFYVFFIIFMTYIFYSIVVKKVTDFSYYRFVNYQFYSFFLFFFLFSIPYYLKINGHFSFIQSMLIFSLLLTIYLFLMYKKIKNIELTSKMLELLKLKRNDNN